MNYTENYHLPQWEETDRILRTDFNRMCADMEAGMSSNAQAAEKAAELPYVVGTYTGDGETYRNIDVGFRPRFVIICGDQKHSQSNYGGNSVIMAGVNQSSLRLYMTNTGFRLDGSHTTNPYPYVNTSGTVYDYIAFR